MTVLVVTSAGGESGVANHSPDSGHNTLPNKGTQPADLPKPGPPWIKGLFSGWGIGGQGSVDTTLHTHEDLSVNRTYTSGKHLSTGRWKH